MIYKKFNIFCCIVSNTTILKAAGPFKAGNLGKAEFCRPDEFVIGVELIAQRNRGRKIEEIWTEIWQEILTLGFYKGEAYDHHGVTGIHFFCSKVPVDHGKGKPLNESEVAIRLASQDVCIISSNEYYPKDHFITKRKFCPGGFVNGFQLKSKKPQSSSDDMSIVNIKVFCTSGTTFTFDGLQFDECGEDGEEHKCPKDTAICGLRTKVESDHSSNYYTQTNYFSNISFLITN